MMEQTYEGDFKDVSSNCDQKIILHPLYLPKLPPWLDLKVFYIRVCKCEVDESTPDHLTVNHIPLHPDTVLEVNGRRSSIYSDCVSSYLRRDRVDRRTEEATFVSTDSIRITGSVRFDVYDKDDLLLSGVIELCGNNEETIGESKNAQKKWSINCHSMLPNGVSFLKGKYYRSMDSPLPAVEVFIAGCFSGTPTILTKTIKLGLSKKNQRVTLDSIPEHDTTEQLKNVSSPGALQLCDYQDYKMENDELDYSSLYSRAEYTEEEDGELSWFNAGVRVGVGISLGICLGVGLGLGLLVRSYQSTSRNFRRLL